MKPGQSLLYSTTVLYDTYINILNSFCTSDITNKVGVKKLLQNFLC